MLRRKQKEQEPLVPADTPTNQCILDTLKSFDLDPKEVMLVGSAALALHGVELRPFQGPSDNPDNLAPRPADVDLAATSSYMEHLYSHGAPNGQRFRVKTIAEAHNAQTIMQSGNMEGNNLLPLELVTRFQPARGSQEKYDRKLRKYINRVSRPLADTAFRIITLEAVVKNLSASARYEPKADQDIVAIRRRMNTL